VQHFFPFVNFYYSISPAFCSFLPFAVCFSSTWMLARIKRGSSSFNLQTKLFMATLALIMRRGEVLRESLDVHVVVAIARNRIPVNKRYEVLHDNRCCYSFNYFPVSPLHPSVSYFIFSLSLSLFSPSISISRTCISLIHRIRTIEIQEIVFRALRMKLRYFH